MRGASNTVPSAGRVDAAARAAVGACLVVVPQRVIGAVDSGGASGLTVGLTRVLGARHLAEAAILWVHPTTRLVRGIAVVDLIHASSMVAAAAGAPRYRRLTSTSAVVASLLAAINLASVHGSRGVR